MVSRAQLCTERDEECGDDHLVLFELSCAEINEQGREDNNQAVFEGEAGVRVELDRDRIRRRQPFPRR